MDQQTADLNIRRDADSVFEEMFGAEEENETDLK